jgi:hypothetical protein
MYLLSTETFIVLGYTDNKIDVAFIIVIVIRFELHASLADDSEILFLLVDFK